MDEIEVKILEINVKEIEKKLKKLGAKKIRSGNTSSAFYDFKDKALKKKQAILRIREDGDVTELTFKQRLEKKKFKIADEREVHVDNPETLKAILAGLGLHEWHAVRKKRVSYRLGKIHFEFDTIPGIPTYLEIEAPTKADIKKFVDILGLSMKDACSWSAKDVIDYYATK